MGDRYEDLVPARIYLCLTPCAVGEWKSAVTGELNRYRVPFTFKALRNSAEYARLDAGFAASLLIALAGTIGGLRPATPVFARRLAAGIAIADDPPGGLSFGVS